MAIEWPLIQRDIRTYAETLVVFLSEPVPVTIYFYSPTTIIGQVSHGNRSKLFMIISKATYVPRERKTSFPWSLNDPPTSPGRIPKVSRDHSWHSGGNKPRHLLVTLEKSGLGIEGIGRPKTGSNRGPIGQKKIIDLLVFLGFLM